MRPLGDISNTLSQERQGSPAKKEMRGGKQPAAAQVATRHAHADGLDDDLLSSFRHLAVESDSEQADLDLAGGYGADSAEEDGGQDSDGATSVAASSGSSSCHLRSPLEAFATAKARLARSNTEADSLISATLDRLRQQVAEPAVSRPIAAGAGAGTILANNHPQHRNLLPQHQRHHALLLKERLYQTLQLCRALHEQNQRNMERVQELWKHNQELSRSLHEAQLDKEVLQQTIRQLTQEAALLAEQARRALLPPQPAGTEPSQQQQEAPALPAPAGSAAVAPAPAAEQGPDAGQRWSQVAESTAASCSSVSSVRGEAWQPGFECGSEGGAVYVHGSGGSGLGDKRRRLEAGMLRPSIAAALAEAAAMETSGGRLPTPGKTPKRKMRHLSATSTPAVSGAQAAGQQAELAGQQEAGEPESVAAVAPAGEGEVLHALETLEQLEALLESKWLGGGQDVAPECRRAGTTSHAQASGCRVM